MNEFEAPPAELGFADTLISVEFPDLEGSQARRNFEERIGFPGRKERGGEEGSPGSPCRSGSGFAKPQPAMTRGRQDPRCREGGGVQVKQSRWTARCWGSWMVAGLLSFHWHLGRSIPSLSGSVVLPSTRRLVPRAVPYKLRYTTSLAARRRERLGPGEMLVGTRTRGPWGCEGGGRGATSRDLG